jgi:type III pantothenate kinase
VKLLAVDAGNTRIKWALHDGASWILKGAVAHSESTVLEQTWSRLPVPDRILVANVAGHSARRLLGHQFTRWHAPQRWIESVPEQCGVRNGYSNPDRLGCDRWASLIAARRMAQGPCLVVTVGTAMTVDALTADGLFAGGLIVPGPRLMRRVLVENTAGLADEPGEFEIFPTTTGNAIETGVWQALAGAVERTATALEERSGAQPECIASGGGAGLLLPHLRYPARLVDNLVLEGLLVIAREAE